MRRLPGSAAGVGRPILGVAARALGLGLRLAAGVRRITPRGRPLDHALQRRRLGRAVGHALLRGGAVALGVLRRLTAVRATVSVALGNLYAQRVTAAGLRMAQ
jgi:hypothetical protein